MSAQAKPANTIDMSNIKPKAILTKIKGGNKYRSKHNIIRHKSLQASTYQKDSEVPEEIPDILLPKPSIIQPFR